MVKQVPGKMLPSMSFDSAQESARQAFMPLRVRRERNQSYPVRPEFVEGRNQNALKPVLIFGYGNLSRGDDALGPLFLQHAEAIVNLEQADILSDYQLQIEHALDLADRQLVLFADASAAGSGAFAFTEIQPGEDSSYTTHAMSPAAVLAVFEKVNKRPPPPAFLLSIRGERFELGEGLSAAAQDNLKLACDFAGELFETMHAESWRRLAAKVNKTAHA